MEFEYTRVGDFFSYPCFWKKEKAWVRNGFQKLTEVKKISGVALILPLILRKLIFEGRYALIFVYVLDHSYLLNKKTCDIRGNEKKRLPSDADLVDIRGNLMTYKR